MSRNDGGDARRLFGIINTYQRHDVLAETLRSIAGQTLPPSHLVIVDNGSAVDIDHHLRDHPIHDRTTVTVLVPGDNLGPAGGFALGLETLGDQFGPDDLLVCFDDDDPPPRDDLIERLAASLGDVAPTVAGVGLRGGTLSTTRGTIIPQPVASGLVDVDHLHGGYLPIYRATALQEVGGFDSSLFWGFEELDLGRRLRAAGYWLQADAGLLAEVVDQYPKTLAPRRSIGLAKPSWRHYYRHRNLLHVLRSERAWSGIALTIGVRLILKPLLLGLRGPRRAWWHLRTNLAAIRDGAIRAEIAIARPVDRRE